MYWLCFMEIFSHPLCQAFGVPRSQHSNGYYTNLYSCSLKFLLDVGPSKLTLCILLPLLFQPLIYPIYQSLVIWYIGIYVCPDRIETGIPRLGEKWNQTDFWLKAKQMEGWECSKASPSYPALSSCSHFRLFLSSLWQVWQPATLRSHFSPSIMGIELFPWTQVSRLVWQVLLPAWSACQPSEVLRTLLFFSSPPVTVFFMDAVFSLFWVFIILIIAFCP